MKKAQLENLVKNTWWAIERIAGHTALLADALRESERIEREHRAMGKRFTGGRNGYTLSVEWTARYFVARQVLEVRPAPTTWLEAAGWRSDILYSQALREELLKDGRLAPYAINVDGAFWDIDYAGDIALPVAS
jgi:hypothetical protein